MHYLALRGFLSLTTPKLEWTSMPIHRKVDQSHGTVSIDGQPRDMETNHYELAWESDFLGRGNNWRTLTSWCIELSHSALF